MPLEKPYLRQINLDGDGKSAKKPYFSRFCRRSKRAAPIALELELPTIRELATIRGHGSFISALAWSRDGRYLAVGGADKQVKIWDVDHVNHDDAPVEGARVTSSLATVFSEAGEL